MSFSQINHNFPLHIKSYPITSIFVIFTPVYICRCAMNYIYNQNTQRFSFFHFINWKISPCIVFHSPPKAHSLFQLIFNVFIGKSQGFCIVNPSIYIELHFLYIKIFPAYKNPFLLQIPTLLFKFFFSKRDTDSKTQFSAG